MAVSTSIAESIVKFLHLDEKTKHDSEDLLNQFIPKQKEKLVFLISLMKILMLI